MLWWNKEMEIIMKHVEQQNALRHPIYIYKKLQMGTNKKPGQELWLARSVLTSSIFSSNWHTCLWTSSWRSTSFASERSWTGNGRRGATFSWRGTRSMHSGKSPRGAWRRRRPSWGTDRGKERRRRSATEWRSLWAAHTQFRGLLMYLGKVMNFLYFTGIFQIFHF